MPPPFVAVVWPEWSPVRRSWWAATFILIAHFAERSAYFGFTSTIIYQLTATQFNWDMSNARTLLLIYICLSFFVGLISAFFSDFLLSRTALLGFAAGTYFLGLTGLMRVNYEININNDNTAVLCSALPPISSHNSSTAVAKYTNEVCNLSLTAAAILMGVGAGLAKPLLPILGADQIAHLGESAVRKYFVLFYFTSSMASLMVYNIYFLLWDEHNWSAFLILSIVLVFVSTFVLTLGLLFLAQSSHYTAEFDYILEISLKALPCYKNVKTNNQMLLCEEADFVNHPPKVRSFGFHRLKLENGGDFLDLDVESARSFCIGLAVAWMIIPFYVIYSQVDTAFMVEAYFFKFPQTFASYFTNSTSWLQSCISIPSIGCSLLLACVIYPSLERRHIVPSYRARMLFASTLAVLCMCMAAIVEYCRTHFYEEDVVQNIGGSYYIASSMSVFWIYPANAVLAIGETIMYTTVLEYVYLLAAPWLQATPIALVCSSIGAAELIASYLSQQFATLQSGDQAGSFSGKLNKSDRFSLSRHVDWLFLALGGVQMGCVVLYLVLFRCCAGGAFMSTQHVTKIQAKVTRSNWINETVTSGLQTYPCGQRPPIYIVQ